MFEFFSVKVINTAVAQFGYSTSIMKTWSCFKILPISQPFEYDTDFFIMFIVIKSSKNPSLPAEYKLYLENV